MSAFRVDLGDIPAKKQFKKFKSLRKAARWARDQFNAGLLERTEILDGEGNPVDVDWDSPEFLDRGELRERLAQAEASRDSKADQVQKLQEEQAARDNAMIEAGYIPIRALAPHLMDIRVEREADDYPIWSSPALIPQPMKSTFTLRLQQFDSRVGGQPHPFVTAMQALAERGNRG